GPGGCGMGKRGGFWRAPHYLKKNRRGISEHDARIVGVGPPINILVTFLVVTIGAHTHHFPHTHPAAAFILVDIFKARRGHTILVSDWSSDVCSSDLLSSSSLVSHPGGAQAGAREGGAQRFE